MTFIGPVLRFTQDNIIAITGGDLAPMLDGLPFPMYQAVLVKKDRNCPLAACGTDAGDILHLPEGWMFHWLWEANLLF